MDNQPLLSLCIPTNGAVQWVLPVLDSIYSQNYDQNKYEVVITDNGKDSQLASYLKDYDYPNLRYIVTSDEGFLNLVTSLKEGRGLFCKMINHRSVMRAGSIGSLVTLIEKYKETKPLIYCTDGNLKINDDSLECPDTDSFVNSMSYWCSWSAGIGFWDIDKEKLGDVKLDIMFPNASLLFDTRDNPQYVIWNKKYQDMADDSGKGGYDLFQTFGVGFLDIVNGLRIKGRISQETFLKVKKDIRVFLEGLYLSEVVLPTNHTFIIGDVKGSLSVYYSKYVYYLMATKNWLKAPYYFIRRFLS